MNTRLRWLDISENKKDNKNNMNPKYDRTFYDSRV